MSTRNLEKIFAPKRIAVVGASDDPGSVGQTVLRNLIGMVSSRPSGATRTPSTS